MRQPLDGDEALPLQAFEYSERRRQQFTALAVVPTPACDRRLDGDDQELGRHPFVTRLHCHARSLRRQAAAHPIAFASSILVDRLSTKAEAEGGKSVTGSAKPSPTS